MPRFSLRQLIVAFALFAMLGGLYVYSKRTPLLALYGSRRNLELVRSATQVELYRLGPPARGLPTGPTPVLTPLEYPIAAGPVPLPRMAAPGVGYLLTSEGMYNWEYPQLCDQPIYEIKLSVYHGSERIDLYLSFCCDTMTVAKDGTTFGSADFNGMVLKDLVRQAFPGWDATPLPKNFFDGR